MFVFKNGYTESRAEWSELSCKTQPFETVAEKYPSSDVSTILLTDVNIYSDHTEKPKESPTLYTQLQQPRRKTSSCRDKTLAHTVSVQTRRTVTDGISRRVTSGREKTSLN